VHTRLQVHVRNSMNFLALAEDSRIEGRPCSCAHAMADGEGLLADKVLRSALAG
jgi:hypothetical protein